MRHFDLWHSCRRWREQGISCPFRVLEREESEEDAEGKPVGGAMLAAAAAAAQSRMTLGQKKEVAVGVPAEIVGDIVGVPLEIEGQEPVTVPVSKGAEPIPTPLSFIDQMLQERTITDGMVAALLSTMFATSLATQIYGGMGGFGGMQVNWTEIMQGITSKVGSRLVQKTFLPTAEGAAARAFGRGAVDDRSGLSGGMPEAALISGVAAELRRRRGALAQSRGESFGG